MFLESLLQRVENSFFELGKNWLKPSPQTQLRQRLDQLRAEKDEGERAQREAEQQAQQLRHQIASQQPQIERLIAQIALCVRNGTEANAWPLVLQLEEVRAACTAAQERLPRLEQAAWSHQFQVRQLERELTRLENDVPPPPPAPEPRPEPPPEKRPHKPPRR